MCTQWARRAVRRWLPSGWRNVLKLSHPEYERLVPHVPEAPPSRENVFSTVWNPSTAPLSPALCYDTSQHLYSFMRSIGWPSPPENVTSCPVNRKWCSWGMESSTSGSLQRMTTCSCTKIKPWDRPVLTQWRTCNRLLLWWGRDSSVCATACPLLGLSVKWLHWSTLFPISTLFCEKAYNKIEIPFKNQKVVSLQLSWRDFCNPKKNL